MKRRSAARLAVGVALVGAVVAFVGAGLAGTGSLADYNLALDDGVKGCPTYEAVRPTP